MNKILFILFFLFVPSVNAGAINIDLKGWPEISDKHFKVLYRNESDQSYAREILDKAEIYYSSIADRIGYERFQNFWTWDDRVPIVLYPSQEEFSKSTGRPLWSKGFAVSHLSSVNLRMIVTFKEQDNFLVATLPHEISHLILHDFIGPGRTIPMWFDEGVAQLEEERTEEQEHMATVARLISNGQSIPLLLLHNPNPSLMLNPTYVGIFYAESLYIVDFLVKTYGKESFIDLCRNLRDGKDFEEALKSAYFPSLDSLNKLQDEWIKHMMQYL